jgi:hypothetical protein
MPLAGTICGPRGRIASGKAQEILRLPIRNIPRATLADDNEKPLELDDVSLKRLNQARTLSLKKSPPPLSAG